MSSTKPRYILLDALRGFALLGICLANYPEFSLWSFAPQDLHTPLDGVVQAVLTFLVDGKFYTLFSVLFGMGFAIQLENAGQDASTFYRRMAGLLVIGALHLMFLWSGDILVLYAAMGMALPLFRKCSTKGLLLWAGAFLLLPVVLEAAVGSRLADPVEAAWWKVAAVNGIGEANFHTYLRDASSYREVFAFLVQGAVERTWEFVSSHRYFKVLGLFLIGFAAGRGHVFARVGEFRPMLRRILAAGLAVGIPADALYTWSSVQGHPWGGAVHSVLYLLGVYPVGLAYAAGFCLLYQRGRQWRVWKVFAATGRMACTNYILQSVLGILIFYGIGFGLGAGTDLSGALGIAVCVYILETICSGLWLSRFRWGPVEWIWRMFTYGRKLDIRIPKVPVETPVR